MWIQYCVDDWSIFLVQLKFWQLEIPPNFGVDYLGCVGGFCETFKQLTEICGTGPHNLSGAFGLVLRRNCFGTSYPIGRQREIMKSERLFPCGVSRQS